SILSRARRMPVSPIVHDEAFPGDPKIAGPRRTTGDAMVARRLSGQVSGTWMGMTPLVDVRTPRDVRCPGCWRTRRSARLPHRVAKRAAALVREQHPVRVHLPADRPGVAS